MIATAKAEQQETHKTKFCKYAADGASVAECTNDKISTDWFDGDGDARYVIWFFRDPSSNCEFKYHTRYTTNGVSDLKSKLSATMLTLLRSSASCTGYKPPATLKSTLKLSTATTPTVPTKSSTQPASDGRCPVVIDVRTQGEWDDKGHASCAHRLEIQEDPSLVEKVSTLANGDLSYPVYVYCQTGVRSGRAKKILQDKKWTHVTVGGWETQSVAIEKLCDCKSSENPVSAAQNAIPGWMMLLGVCMLTLNQIFV